MVLRYEIILVDDVSKDNTSQAINVVTKKYNNVIGIELMFNVGQFMALMCGLERSKGEFVITMDDDLQHAPEDIPSLYKHMQDNPYYDAVFAASKIKQHSLFRRMGSLFVKKINEIIFNKPKNITMSPFRCLRRSLVNAITSCKTKYPIMGPLILKLTRRIDNLEVTHLSRFDGKSNYSFLKLVSTTLSNILNFTSAPLAFISWLGIIVCFLSFIIASYFTLRYFFYGSQLSGFTTIIVFMNFFGGLIIFCVGIIGTYLASSFQENNKHPRYLIREERSGNGNK